MARTHQQRHVFPQPQAEVYRAAERAIVEAGMKIAPGATDYQIRVTQGVSGGSWGERISLTLATFPGGGTQVVIESKLVLGLWDWGRNADNVTTLFASMESVLGPGTRLETDS